MKSTLIGFLILFVVSSSSAQVDSAGLKDAMQKLDQALLQKDEAVLRSVLHKEASYGHSNGWIQSKSDILNDFKSGKLVYEKIENNSSAIVNISKKYATVKTNTNAEGAVNGTAFKLTLHVMQFWIKTKKGWQLIARQSAKQS
jgi:uncharacterized protein DUF4440